jgi:hypothetical protein
MFSPKNTSPPPHTPTKSLEDEATSLGELIAEINDCVKALKKELQKNSTSLAIIHKIQALNACVTYLQGNSSAALLSQAIQVSPQFNESKSVMSNLADLMSESKIAEPTNLVKKTLSVSEDTILKVKANNYSISSDGFVSVKENLPSVEPTNNKYNKK